MTSRCIQNSRTHTHIQGTVKNYIYFCTKKSESSKRHFYYMLMLFLHEWTCTEKTRRSLLKYDVRIPDRNWRSPMHERNTARSYLVLEFVTLWSRRRWLPRMCDHLRCLLGTLLPTRDEASRERMAAILCYNSVGRKIDAGDLLGLPKPAPETGQAGKQSLTCLRTTLNL